MLWDVAYTTGTTSGRPSPFYNTTHDAYAIWDQARRCNEAEGLRPDRPHCQSLSAGGFPDRRVSQRHSLRHDRRPAGGAWADRFGAFRIQGAPFAQRGARHGPAARPTVLWGVPSFVRRFLDEARRQRRDLADVRLVITSGEPVPAALRGELADLLGGCGARSVAFRARYAFTEMQGGLVQCADHAPAQNVTPDLYYLEVVDPRQRTAPAGWRGRHARRHPPAPPGHRAAALSGRRHRHAVVRAVPDLRPSGRAGCRDAAADRKPGEVPRHAGEHRRGARSPVSTAGPWPIPTGVHARGGRGRNGPDDDPHRARGRRRW